MVASMIGGYFEGHGSTEADNFNERFPEWEEFFENHGVNEYPLHGSGNEPQCFDLWPTPGYYNDGRGNHLVGDDSLPNRYSAYQSVAIFLNKEPDRETIEFLKARATEFALADGFSWKAKTHKITNFRLLKETMTVEYDTISI